VRNAAVAFLASLSPEQRAKTVFPVDDGEWRKWNNVHRYTRQGVSFKEMSAEQRAKAFGLLQAGLSAKGFQKSRDIMRLNETIAEMTQRLDEYGEGLYNLTVMGEPSDTQPWGWQLDGHHLIINYFILRDQVVMTPTFMGSEPVHADAGKYAGTTVMQDEQNKGLALMLALTPEQQKKATLQSEKTANNSLAQAFRDNLVLDYAGLRGAEMSAEQKKRLLTVIDEYVGNMSAGHAKVRLQEVEKHLDDTYFAWIGGTGPEAVFYYRIQSPVILIEFDHQTPVALPGPKVPGRIHVHSVVRTPNGNDYGKDLLRQHYVTHQGDPAHGHQQ
jgi:predicted nuclease of restriction endonuclease-like (RecB) superfamily